MTRIILIQDDDAERQYQESMNYLNPKYHNQPTNLKNIPTDPKAPLFVRLPATPPKVTGKTVI